MKSTSESSESSHAVNRESPSRDLARFLAGLRFEALPPSVVCRAEDAFLDWLACALAGRGAQPIRILEQFASTMGPPDGPSEILVSGSFSSPFFAALVNGAASHITEQDDVHNGARFHPGVVVFPAVLAAAQQNGASGQDFIVAAVAGYEAAVRVGEFLGRSHYQVFHTTGTAGTLGAAAGVGRVLNLNVGDLQHALGSAGTQAAGLWEFLGDGADSKILHSAKAAADGLLSAYIARDGFTGAAQILEGRKGMGVALSCDADPAKLTDGLGERWAILECSYKIHACCRHTHPSADALLALMREHELSADDIVHVTAHVHHEAIDVLGGITNPETVHQSKFSMGFVLALIALYKHAHVVDFTEATLRDAGVRAFLSRVDMVLDPEIDCSPGNYWGGRVEVRTRDGRHLEGRVAVAKGDPENSLDRQELESKALNLAAFAGSITPDKMRRIISRAWTLRDQPNVRHFLA